jgi:SAM-dependent methyltransferase
MTPTETPHHRLAPPVWRHDWFTLRRLRYGIEAAIAGHRLAAPGVRVIDLGSGDAPYRPLFNAAGCDYVTCDLDGRPDVRIELGCPIPLPAGAADGVVSFQVLEHVWDLDWYLGECRRLVKPSGWLLLSTHGTWPYHPHPTDFRRWTRDGLVKELETRGFAVTECAPVVGPLAWTTQIRLLGYREAARRVPVLGPAVLAPLAMLMNLRMVIEDAVTPAAVTAGNAAVYVTVSRAPGGGEAA